MLKKIVISLMAILFINMAYAYNISVEGIFTNSDGSPRQGTFSGNFTIINETSDTIFTDVSSVTTDINGRFHKYYDVNFTQNSTLRARWKLADEDSGWQAIGYSFYSINSQRLQGKDVKELEDDFIDSGKNATFGTIIADFLGSISNWISAIWARWVHTDNLNATNASINQVTANFNMSSYNITDIDYIGGAKIINVTNTTEGNDDVVIWEIELS